MLTVHAVAAVLARNGLREHAQPGLGGGKSGKLLAATQRRGGTAVEEHAARLAGVGRRLGGEEDAQERLAEGVGADAA